MTTSTTSVLIVWLYSRLRRKQTKAEKVESVNVINYFEKLLYKESGEMNQRVKGSFSFFIFMMSQNKASMYADGNEQGKTDNIGTMG